MLPSHGIETGASRHIASIDAVTVCHCRPCIKCRLP